ncbi:MAG: acylphosphatase [Conexivisphaerales archaeon]
MKARVEVNVYGLVQGVGYRAFVKRAADTLHIYGYAENMPDGSVRIVAEGEMENLEELIKECSKGPTLSQVESITKKWYPYTGEFFYFEYF